MKQIIQNTAKALALIASVGQASADNLPEFSSSSFLQNQFYNAAQDQNDFMGYPERQIEGDQINRMGSLAVATHANWMEFQRFEAHTDVFSETSEFNSNPFVASYIDYVSNYDGLDVDQMTMALDIDRLVNQSLFYFADDLQVRSQRERFAQSEGIETGMPEGHTENWKSSYEALSTSMGDCEDFALLKYTTLKSMGFDEDNMRVMIGYIESPNFDPSQYPENVMDYVGYVDGTPYVYHAFLTVEADGVEWILENGSDANVKLDLGRDFIPVMSFSGDQVYGYDTGAKLAGFPNINPSSEIQITHQNSYALR
jgi:predicted transglutaminase-like cysteine proteinase